ncbi:MAG TPA: LacI family DNA-binding transcriptional regulator [Bacteroidia bacterium]|jgi:LacI family transcriptional regulator|nr:LacI family DNA-binding transcriptional regulator [Bacteroidia bacterium]
MKRLQLEDLSKQLGYSKTLISMVLNGKADQYGISKKTQAIVLDAVSKLDYTPNKFARALRTGKSNFIGLIVADISNTFYSTIAKNIEGTLFHRGYNLMVCSSDEDEDREKKLIDMMINQQGVDGIILASTFKSADYFNNPRFTKTPLVFIDRILPLFNGNFVVTDNYGGSKEIVEALIKKGCKKILCLSITPSYISTIDDRIKGYTDSVEKFTLNLSDEFIVPINYNKIQEDTLSALKKMFFLHADIDAIYALNNHLAVATLKAFKDKSISKYYDNVQLACFDDIELFNLVDKPILSVSQPVDDIGRNATLLTLDIIDGKKENKSMIVLPTSLIVR